MSGKRGGEESEKKNASQEGSRKVRIQANLANEPPRNDLYISATPIGNFCPIELSVPFLRVVASARVAGEARRMWRQQAHESCEAAREKARHVPNSSGSLGIGQKLSLDRRGSRHNTMTDSQRRVILIDE
jgi:hypothetical protein